MISPTRELGPAVRRLRDDAGVKQKELAEAAGIHVNTLLSFEKGRSDPEPGTVEAIAEALGVSVTVIEAEAARMKSGHLVVTGTGEVEYDPNPDPEGTPAEQLMAYLGVKVGMRRLAGELTAKDLIAVAYTLARSEGFSAEEYKKLDAWRDQILEEERGS